MTQRLNETRSVEDGFARSLEGWSERSYRWLSHKERREKKNSHEEGRSKGLGAITVKLVLEYGVESQ